MYDEMYITLKTFRKNSIIYIPLPNLTLNKFRHTKNNKSLLQIKITNYH